MVETSHQGRVQSARASFPGCGASSVTGTERQRYHCLCGQHNPGLCPAITHCHGPWSSAAIIHTMATATATVASATSIAAAATTSLPTEYVHCADGCRVLRRQGRRHCGRGRNHSHHNSGFLYRGGYRRCFCHDCWPSSLKIDIAKGSVITAATPPPRSCQIVEAQTPPAVVVPWAHRVLLAVRSGCAAARVVMSGRWIGEEVTMRL